MLHDSPNWGRPIRVIVFSGGPALDPGMQEFVCRLEDHPEVDFLGAFCQSSGESLGAIWRDLWRRRRLLAGPLFLMQVAGMLRCFLIPRARETHLRRKLARLTDRLKFVPEIHADDVMNRIRSLAPDLGLVYGSPILKPKLFEIPTLGTLGIHHGKVPEYRGKKTTFWAMYNGERTAGVTIQKINAGLDTGQIVKTGEVEIGGKPYRQVWQELEELGLALYVQAVLEVKRNQAIFSPQIGKKGKLYRDPEQREVLRFWLRQLRTQWFRWDRRSLAKTSSGEFKP
jgi:folate-dependent phosphoribosylglycinamide formyltransferase PurN